MPILKDCIIKVTTDKFHEGKEHLFRKLSDNHILRDYTLFCNGPYAVAVTDDRPSIRIISEKFIKFRNHKTKEFHVNEDS